MCFQVFLSNRLGAAGMGLLQLVAAVGFFASTVGSAGVRTASMYLAAEEYGARRPGGMRLSLRCCLIYGSLMSLLAGTALFFCAEPIAAAWIGDSRAASSLRIYAVFLPASCLWSVMAGYFTACSRLRQLVLAEFADQAISLGLTAALLLFWAGNSTELSCCAVMLGNGIATVLTLGLLLAQEAASRLPPAPEGLRMWRRLTRLCVPLAVSDITRSGLSTAEHLLIPRGLGACGSSPERAMAAYGTIHGMVFPVLMFPSVLISSLADLLVPELARCRAAKQTARIRALSDRCLRLGLIFAAAVAGLFASTADPLGRLLYHSTEAGYYLRCFSPLVLILYLDAMVDGMHKGLGQQVFCARVNLLTSALDVALLLVLLPRYGIAGYFFCFTATRALNFLLSILRLYSVAGTDAQLSLPLKAIGCGGAAAALALRVPAAVPLPGCLARAAVFCGTFLLLLRLTRALRRSDLLRLGAALAAGKTG